MTDQQPASTAYHQQLKIGKVYDPIGMMTHPSPSIATMELLPLDEMLVPEKPRSGEENPAQCWHCRPHESWIWADDLWHLTSENCGMPFFGALVPNAHVTLDSASPELLASLGDRFMRLSKAVKLIPGVARLHYGRFNDGGWHWHTQVVARPEGMMQARGVMS